MNRDIWLRVGIVAFGGLLCVLLFLADKTNLNNESSASIGQPATLAGSSQAAATLPPLAPDARLEQWQSILNQREGSAKVEILDSVIQLLSDRNRLAYAADYAAQRATLQPNLEYQVAAGVLSQRATELDYVRNDTTLLTRYQQQATRWLEEAVSQNPENEAALLALGLVRIQSAAPMQGILTIRSVLDINPDNLEASLRLGQFSLQTGQFAKAQQRFEKVLSLDPGNQQARYGLAVAFSQLGQADQAKPLLTTVVSEADDPELKQAAQELLNQL
jgi:outer membrane protein